MSSPETDIRLIQQDVKYIREKIDGIVTKVNEHDQRLRDIELKLASSSGKERGITSAEERNDRKFKLAITALILVTSAINILIAIFH